MVQNQKKEIAPFTTIFGERETQMKLPCVKAWQKHWPVPLLCPGNTVPAEEQVDVKTVALEGEQLKEGTPPGPGGLTMATSFVGLAGGGTSAISEAERQQLESEKMSLYQQLDDKVSF